MYFLNHDYFVFTRDLTIRIFSLIPGGTTFEIRLQVNFNFLCHCIHWKLQITQNLDEMILLIIMYMISFNEYVRGSNLKCRIIRNSEAQTVTTMLRLVQGVDVQQFNC